MKKYGFQLILVTLVVLNTYSMQPESLKVIAAKSTVTNIINPMFDTYGHNFSQLITEVDKKINELPPEAIKLLGPAFFDANKADIIQTILRQPIKIIEPDEKELIFSFTFDTQEQYLIVTSFQNGQDRIKFFEIPNFTLTKTINIPGDKVKLSKSGNIISIMSDIDITIRKRSENLFNIPHTIKPKNFDTSIDNYLINDEETYLATLSAKDKTITIWDLKTYKLVTTEVLPFKSEILSTIAKNTFIIALTNNNDDNKAHLIILDGKKIVHHPLGNNITTLNEAKVEINTKAKILAIVSGYYPSKSFDLWNTEDGTKITKFTGHSKNINYIKFNNLGTLIASSSSDNTVRLWNIQKFTSKTLTGHTKSVNAAVFNPDQTLLISASQDKTIRIWDITKQLPIELVNITEHAPDIDEISFIPKGWLFGGQSLICFAKKSDIRLWFIPTHDKFTLHQFMWLKALAWAERNLAGNKRKKYLEYLEQTALRKETGLFAEEDPIIKEHLRKIIEGIKSQP